MKKLVFVILMFVMSIPMAHAEYAPRTLYIPRLGFEYPIPIVEIPFEDTQWDVAGLGNYVGWLEYTGWIQGNTVLVGHINYSYYPGPFVALDTMQIGDLIYLNDGSTQYTYVVSNIFKVDPSEVWVTEYTPFNQLTLLTCADWDGTKYAKRLVVVALPM